VAQSAGTVFLVDDDASVRRAVARLLRSARYHVETFGSAAEFLGADRRPAAPACVVIDLRMPAMDGLDLQTELRVRGLPLPVVFLTGHGDVPSSVSAMKAGAVDFLAKPVLDEDLLRAVETALAQDARERKRREELRALRARAETLTPRERQVMELVAEGLLNKQIASRLGTAEKTVKVHRGRVMEKMQFVSVADLVRAVERLGGMSR
jgi:FixJ family two-component response regulator